MSKLDKRRAYLWVVAYSIIALGIVAIVVLHLAGMIASIEYPLVFLILILVGLPILPNISELTISRDGYVSVRTKIKSANKEDVKSMEDEIKQELCDSSSVRVDLRPYILEEICKIKGMDKSAMQINRQIEVINDKIGNFNPVFLWYSNINNEEIFYEPKFTTVNRAFYNKIYVMLSKIVAYNEQHKKHLKLVLLVIRKNERGVGVSDSERVALERCFERSEKDGIFEIEDVEINKS